MMPLNDQLYQAETGAVTTLDEISSAPERRRLVPVIAPRGGRGSSPLDHLLSIAVRIASREGLFEEGNARQLFYRRLGIASAEAKRAKRAAARDA